MSGASSPTEQVSASTPVHTTMLTPSMDGQSSAEVLIPAIHLHTMPMFPSNLAFLPDEAEYVPDNFISRLTGIINFTEVDTNHYNIGLIPSSATWGAAGGGSGLDHYLCYCNKLVVA
ncbi:hypothetical protein GY45DRAFT_1373862 [Cubamyces sp. BRFM 1775]|nr:hypothetical protein GY45DRAFT_1373862 [Cubamyces sp. BRFM 1775]